MSPKVAVGNGSSVILVLLPGMKSTHISFRSSLLSTLTEPQTLSLSSVSDHAMTTHTTRLCWYLKTYRLELLSRRPCFLNMESNTTLLLHQHLGKKMRFRSGLRNWNH